MMTREGLLSMSRDLIRLMQSFFPPARAVGETAWRPAVDVYRTSRGWLLKFDLAGVRPEDVSLTVEGCRVTIRGVRRDLQAEQGHHYYRMEITYNHFERCVELPCDVEPASVATDYRHGMLLVHLITEAPK
jgi:HSP20 family protein